MARLPVHQLKTNTRELNLGSARVYHMPDWNNLSHPERLAVIRQIAMMRGRDPRIAKLALKIFKTYGARPREYKKQAAALLKWVQNPKNIYFVNEPGERLQDPIYTITQGKAGDCDDVILVLTALFESVALPWKLVLSGRNQVTGEKIRYIEGEPVPADCKWAHIYAVVGDRPFRPNKWYFAEPTVEGVPLGWDVIGGDESYLPEMAKPSKNQGPAQIVRLKAAPVGYKRPRGSGKGPVYDMAYGDGSSLIPMAVGATIAESIDTSKASGTSEESVTDWRKLAIAIATGVAVSVGTSLLLDWVNGKGLWDGTGSVVSRWQKTTDKVADSSALAHPPLY